MKCNIWWRYLHQLKPSFGEAIEDFIYIIAFTSLKKISPADFKNAAFKSFNPAIEEL